MPFSALFCTSSNEVAVDFLAETKDLVAGYKDQVVLDHLNFRARKGEVTVILGGSGCGKTTLLKLIIGLLYPVSGDVLLFDKSIVHMDEGDLERMRQRTGILFQGGALFNSMTVLDNVALPLREHTQLPSRVIKEMVRLKLDLVGLGHALHYFPSELSGGMRKRVALARATALDPELLICDEPSAGLDPFVAADLDELLLTFKRLFNMTLIVVTHEIQSVQTIADWVVMLDEGKILAEGTVATLREHSHPMVRNFFKRSISPHELSERSILNLMEPI
jgi:phospholipid/cholesterol/gamma-HCH transport system ATP-binding protein